MTGVPHQSKITAFEPYGPLLWQAAQSFFDRRDARADTLRVLIDRLPGTHPSRLALDQDWVTIGTPSDLSAEQQTRLREVLTGLKPWRKGPFDLFGIRIESEWNSGLKWRRVVPHILPLDGRRVLDVGCSNGYYMLRMTSQSPRLLLGIEPYAAYYYQFLALQHYFSPPHLYGLPLRLEDLTGIHGWFDTLFCMGILYHRKSPLDTLTQLRTLMAPEGQLILETLIIEGAGDVSLCPRERYACMRNVYFIPTVDCLFNWLERCGFAKIRCVDITVTSADEQRKTDWIDSDSLESFLNPRDARLTLEGYPAPVRAVVIARAA